MGQKIIVNGVNFKKISPSQVEKIEAECRKYRSEQIWGSIKSLTGLLIYSVQKLFGVTRGYRVN